MAKSATQARGRDCDGCTEERVVASYVALLNTLPCPVPHGDPAYSCKGYSPSLKKVIYRHGQICIVEPEEEEKKVCGNCCKPKCPTCLPKQACVYTYYCLATGEEIECPDDFLCACELDILANGGDVTNNETLSEILEALELICEKLLNLVKEEYHSYLISKCKKIDGWIESVVDEVTCYSGFLCLPKCKVWQLFALPTANIGDWIKIGGKTHTVTESDGEPCALTDLAISGFCDSVEVSSNNPASFGLSIDEADPTPLAEDMFSKICPTCTSEYKSVLTTEPLTLEDDEQAGGCTQAPNVIHNYGDVITTTTVTKPEKESEIEPYEPPPCEGCE